MDREAAKTQLLDAAADLFYTRGIQAVGMDDIRDASGVSLKRLYQLFPAKELLIEAYLQRRDIQWRRRLAEYVALVEGPEERVLAVFDWLRIWFGEPGFRGCAWINAYGELGAVSDLVAAQARHHKSEFRIYLSGLVDDAGLPGELADGVFLLAEGAMVTAGILGTVEPAGQAGAAARLLLNGRAAAV